MENEDMCRVRVIFFGAIRGIVRLKDDYVLLSKNDASLASLIQVLSERYGERLSNILSREERSAPLVTFFLNGKSIGTNERDEKELILSNGSEVEVSLVSQMSGGLD
ncbi:MAG: MoaD/ThiS family protein [Nitrososphaerales archaeon]